MKRRHKNTAGILCLLLLVCGGIRVPLKKLPKQDDPDKVYLVNSDELTFDKEQSADYRVLRGNVVFRKIVCICTATVHIFMKKTTT